VDTIGNLPSNVPCTDAKAAVVTTSTMSDFAARGSILKSATNQRFIRLKITRP
jgi:hypothetical protein